MTLAKFLNPKSIAVVGVSNNPAKIGAVIYLNLIKGGFSGDVFAVNPNHKEVFGNKCYRSVGSIPKEIDLVVVATPAPTVPSILKDAKKKGVKHAIVISGGFGESGRTDLEDEFKKVAKDMHVIGPNCLGVYSAKSRVDTLFFPHYKLERPAYGKVGIISQSGGVGSSFLALASRTGLGIHSFFSYGNAYNMDESDIIREYANIKDVEVILSYVEGVKDGKKFLSALDYAAAKKPIIVLKAGKEGRAKKAAHTHTGALAGDYIAYKAAFKKAGILEAYSLEEMFDFAKIFSQPLPKGNRIGIITNGGGFGVMATDEAIKLGLEVPPLTEAEKKAAKKRFPAYVTPANPFDVVADADVERYRVALETMLNSKSVDMVLVNVLFQPPAINSSLVEELTKYVGKKPIAIAVPGGNVEEGLRRMLTISGLPAYPYPERGVRALHALYTYSKMKNQKS